MTMVMLNNVDRMMHIVHNIMIVMMHVMNRMVNTIMMNWMMNGIM